MSKIQNKDILKSIPLLASVLGNRYNVEVVIGGNTAMTNGNIIYLPSLPENSDETFISLLRAYIDHESAHIRYTDFELLKSTSITDLEKYVWNCIEDWRIEEKMSTIFNGCRNNFNWLIKHIFYDNYKVVKKKTLQAVLPQWLLLKIRAWDVPILESHTQKLEKYLKKTSPKLLAELGALLLEVKAQCRNTAEALEHAKRIVACIEKYSKQNSTNQEEKSEQDEQNQHDENVEQSNSDEQNQQPQQENQTQGENNDDSTSTNGEMSISSDTQKDVFVSQDDMSIMSDFNDLLSSSSKDLPQQIDEKVKQFIRKEQGKSTENKIHSAIIGHKSCEELDSKSIQEAKSVSNALKARLQGLLQAQTLTRNSPSSHGKLNKNCLHKLAVKNSKVFLQQNKVQATNCAVHILWDTSGSMSDKMEETCKACYTLASALENTKGINVGVTTFPAYSHDYDAQSLASYRYLYPLIEHGNKVHTRFQLPAYGTTPLTESLYWILPKLLMQKEERKIILLITDGEPDDKASARKALEYAKKFGVEVYGVALEACSIDDLLPNTSITLQGVHELPQAMFGILQSALINNK